MAFSEVLRGFSGVQKVPAQQAPLPPTSDPSPEGHDFGKEADTIHWVRGFVRSHTFQRLAIRDGFMSRAETIFSAPPKKDWVGKPSGEEERMQASCEDITQLWETLKATRLHLSPPT